MDPRDLDHRVTQAHSNKALPSSPGSLWNVVMSRPSSAQSVPSFDVINMDEGYWITSALQEHALAMHQMTLTQGVVDLSDSRHLEPLTCPGEISGTCPSRSSLRSSSRLACVPATTFIENAEISQHCEGIKEQCQSGNTELDTQVAFRMTTHKQHLKCRTERLQNVLIFLR